MKTKKPPQLAASPEQIKTGDLVFSKQDLRNGFVVPGIVLDCRTQECQVVWGHGSGTGWYKRYLLVKDSEE